MPVRFATVGLLTPPCVTVMVPVSVPAADGVNVTEIVQAEPAARLAPQLFVGRSRPDATMLVIEVRRSRRFAAGLAGRCSAPLWAGS